MGVAGHPMVAKEWLSHPSSFSFSFFQFFKVFLSFFNLLKFLINFFKFLFFYTKTRATPGVATWQNVKFWILSPSFHKT
jgi:hypothetical protein